MLPQQNRLAFVHDACAGDDALLREVLTRLDVEPEGRQWWDRSFNAAANAPEDLPGPLIGTLIGRYRVLDVIGAGGMGVVVLAERADRSFSQRVAIKLLKSGVVSAELQSRLKMERQILATLDHPNIAKLLDGGATADGTPYIVMEYIDGQPIDAYCNARKFTVRQRLELFLTVCSSVHYAHQNLIVHRDLKPSNILVTQDGAPKLLDFGIAKLLDVRQFQHTIAVTQADVRLMTPLHASPEQLRGDPISTASDTYVLGVLLYELLTLRKPLAAQGASLGELERLIREETPRPLVYGLDHHAHLSEGDLAMLCDSLSATPAKLRRELTGDLDNIVQMALRKEPERRYASVEQFAEDIRRYLAGKPITARRDTWSYRARKFIGRYPYAVGGSVATVLALLAFTALTMEQNRRITHERIRAEQISGFLVELFEQADPGRSRGNEITVREVLDVGSRRMQSGLQTQPDVRASLLATMGSVYGSLGFYDEAVKLLEDSLQQRRALFGDGHLETADSMQMLGRVLTIKGDAQRAEHFLEEALAINRRLAKDDKVRIGSALNDLANLRRVQERFEESDAIYREALGILEGTKGRGDVLLVESLTDRGRLLAYLGRQDEAIASFGRAIDLSVNTLGTDHPETAHVIQNLADSLARQGRLTEADPLFRRSLELYGKLFGEEHPFTLMAMGNYGRFLQQSGQLDQSEAILREALRLNIKVRGQDHQIVGYTHTLLGVTLLERGDCQASMQEQQAALQIFRKSLPEEHLFIGSARFGLGRALSECGQPQEGEAEIRACLRTFEATAGIDASSIITIEGGLGRSLARQGRYAEAEPLLQRAYIDALQTRDEDDSITRRTRTWIEDLYASWGKPGEGAKFVQSQRERSRPRP